jgi:iron complex transport system permease protein
MRWLPRTRWLARGRLLAREAARWPGFWAAALSAALAVSVLVSARLGPVAVPTADLWEALTREGHPLHVVLWQVRLPRVAAGALVGAALAVSGALLQTVVRNPLADPGLLGVNAGAGVAALLALVLLPDLAWALPLLAFAGAFAAVAAILIASWGPGRRLGPLAIILSGVAIQAVLFSIVALVSFVFADRAPAFVAFTVGSLNGAGWFEAGLVTPLVVLGVAASLLARRPLNLLLLDEASAAGIGVDVSRARFGACAVAALLAAAAVSVAGLVGFVGLVVPNWVRVVSGPDHRTLVPLSALGGAVLVVTADLLARTAASPLELPVGALLALVGGPYFLFILWRKLP